MNLEPALLESVKLGHVDKVKALLSGGADIRHDGDAALREAVFTGSAKMRELIMNRYPNETAREEAVEQIASDLQEMIDGVRKRHKELIARRILKELSGPPIEL